MDLEDFMLGEMSQLKKDKYCIVPLLWMETDTESGMVAARAGEGDGHLLFNGDSLSLTHGKFWRQMVVMVAQPREYP